MDCEISLFVKKRQRVQKKPASRPCGFSLRESRGYESASPTIFETSQKTLEVPP